jgi:hypothetical protein
VQNVSDKCDSGFMPAHTFDFTTLTQAVSKPSPLRTYLHATFPNRRPVAAAYRKSAGQILAPGYGANAGTVGTAFDNLVRLELDPEETPLPAFKGALKLFGGMDQFEEVVGLMMDFRAIASESDEDLARTAWVFALFTESHRHPLPPESLLNALNDVENLTVGSLLDLAADNAVKDVLQLREVAWLKFYPFMEGAVQSGPTFNEELPIAADGDLMSNRTLVEIKTTLGDINSKGQRYTVLSADTLYQLIAYTLLDTCDEHKIDAVAVYSARYGHYFRRELAPLLEELAGRPVNLAQERETVRSIICGG